MKHFRNSSLVLAFTIFAALGIFGQETQVRVVDEVVAQVNDGVITLSKVKRESKSIVDTWVQEGKTREVRNLIGPLPALPFEVVKP